MKGTEREKRKSERERGTDRQIKKVRGGEGEREREK